MREGVDFMSTLVGQDQALSKRFAGFRSKAGIGLFDDAQVHLERYQLLGGRLPEFQGDATPVVFLQIPDMLGWAAAFRALATRHIDHDSVLCGVFSE